MIGVVIVGRVGHYQIECALYHQRAQGVLKGGVGTQRAIGKAHALRHAERRQRLRRFAQPLAAQITNRLRAAPGPVGRHCQRQVRAHVGPGGKRAIGENLEVDRMRADGQDA